MIRTVDVSASRALGRVLEGRSVTFRLAPFYRPALALSAVAIATTLAPDARADVSSWLSLGTGAQKFHGLGLKRDIVPSLRLATGMGSDPSHAFVLGGVARLDTMWGSGTDLSFALRFADHGFANGQWGFALDAGPIARFWGPTVYGATTALTLGGPWGLEVGLQAAIGADDLETYGVFIAIDLARLTVYRRSGTSYWKNSFPAYRPEADASR